MCLPADMRVHLLPTLSRDNSYVGPHLLHRRTVEEPKAQRGREVGTSAGHSLQHGPLDTGPTAGHSSQCVCGASAGHGEKRWRKRPRQRPDGCIVGCRKGTPGHSGSSFLHPQARQEKHLNRGVRLPGLTSPGPSHSPGSEREVACADAGMDSLIQG